MLLPLNLRTPLDILPERDYITLVSLGNEVQNHNKEC